MEKAVAETDREDIQRWTTKRKVALVLSFLKAKQVYRKPLDSTA